MLQGLDTEETILYTIVSVDDVKYDLTKEEMELSDFLKTLTTDCNIETNNVYSISLESKILGKIVEYLKYHKNKKPKDIEKPVLSDFKTIETIEDWDKQFIQSIEEENKLKEIIYGANYMIIDSLIQLCCAKIAADLKNLNGEEEIREHLKKY
jgi:hypothetical protein